VLGFDWHSSGVTTTVCGAIKEGLKGMESELGFFTAGGKGKVSRRTPDEILIHADKHSLGIDAPGLVYASKMSAKVDSTAVQDGYQLYHHVFFFDAAGNWAVVQQGMNETTRWARRYHWLSTGMNDFCCEPLQYDLLDAAAQADGVSVAGGSSVPAGGTGLAGRLADAIDREIAAQPLQTAVTRVRQSEVVEQFRRELETQSLTVTTVTAFLQLLQQVLPMLLVK
jgi:hypothetical protein